MPPVPPLGGPRATAYDVIVVGSGAAGLTAACVAALEGCKVLVLEQAAVFGGTTAISGGMVWIPGNHKMADLGFSDSVAQARAYLDQLVHGGTSARMEAFLAHGDEAVRYLEAHTEVRLRPVLTYPDYYPGLAGATRGGRVLEPEPFDARRLGKAFDLLRDPLPEFTLFGGMMVSRADIPHLRRVGRSLVSTWHAACLLARHGVQRLHARRGTTLYLGNALAARLMASALKLGVELCPGMSVRQLEQHAGRVAGVRARLQSAPGVADMALQARRGVVLATGGLSHDKDLRQRYVPAAAGTLSATVPATGSASGARLAAGVGAKMSGPTEQGAFWVPASTFTRTDGSAGVFPHTVTDRAKPGLIAVDAGGRRFVNEALSYHEFVRAQLRQGVSAIPAHLVCDARFLWTYGLGRIRPFSLSVEDAVTQGYLRRAPSIAALAEQVGVPAEGLCATVEEFNHFAQRGLDPAFGRGGDAYQRHLGDVDVQPNPCVAPIVKAPFYSVAVHPADLGMSAGISTDAQARVLDMQGTPVPGLWACGNDMESVMNGVYPGPGITLGPAITFGYLAGLCASAQP